jgi:hypothetical protein
LESRQQKLRGGWGKFEIWKADSRNEEGDGVNLKFGKQTAEMKRGMG